MRLPNILLVGHGRCGKDTACEYLAKITTLRNAGTTSKYLCMEVAHRLGLSEEEAYARRHESDEMRIQWYNIGNEIREKGPTTLARMAFENGEISGGVRDYEEIVSCKNEGLADIIIWVENNRVPMDPTVKFTSKECDLVIENNWTLEEFYERLARFANFAKLPFRRNDDCDFSQMIQPIKISKDGFTREQIQELGRKGPYRRYEKFEPETESETCNA